MPGILMSSNTIAGGCICALTRAISPSVANRTR
jgi:hypothetical protein